MNWQLITYKPEFAVQKNPAISQHREGLVVNDAHFDKIRRIIPRMPHYMVRKERNGRLLKAWTRTNTQTLLGGTMVIISTTD